MVAASYSFMYRDRSVSLAISREHGVPRIPEKKISLAAATGDSFPGIVPNKFDVPLLPGENFEDAKDEMSDIGEEVRLCHPLCVLRFSLIYWVLYPTIRPNKC